MGLTTSSSGADMVTEVTTPLIRLDCLLHRADGVAPLGARLRGLVQQQVAERDEVAAFERHADLLELAGEFFEQLQNE